MGRKALPTDEFNLTERQRRMLLFMSDVIRSSGYPPTIREICDQLQIRSTSTVHKDLSALEKKGFIERDPAKPRAIKIINETVLRSTPSNRQTTGNPEPPVHGAPDGLRPSGSPAQASGAAIHLSAAGTLSPGHSDPGEPQAGFREFPDRPETRPAGLSGRGEQYVRPDARSHAPLSDPSGSQEPSSGFHDRPDAQASTSDQGIRQEPSGRRSTQAGVHPSGHAGPDALRHTAVVEVPLVGHVAAGVPILAEENISEFFPVPADYIRGSAPHFMLTVRGESMIEAGILDGDCILVRQQNTADNGDMVVAMIDGFESEATVKTFYREGDHIRLQPENASMSPILVRDASILGIVKGIFRYLR